MAQSWQSFLLETDAGFHDEKLFTRDHDQAVSMPCPPACPFTYALGIIKIEGAEAVEFLHGQFISDVAGMGSGKVTLSAWCDPRGRVIGTFILAFTKGVFWILLPASLKDLFLRRLRMYVLRAQVKITDMTEKSNKIAMDKRYMVEKGLPLLEENASGRFLPQELNLDLLGSLSYEKGCYPGQEIIARLRFRGEVKRRLYLASTDNPITLEANTKLAARSEDTPVGAVINGVVEQEHGQDQEQEQKLLIVLDRNHDQSNSLIAQGFPDYAVRVKHEAALL